MFVKCPCQHCNEFIEFEADELSEENSVIPCPHCGLETKLLVPQDKAENTAADASAQTPLEAKFAETSREEQLKHLQEIADSRLIAYNLDTLKLEGGTVKIHRRGFANALAAGLNGERTIQISSLTSVQMKPATWLTPSYILFSYAGSKPFMGGIIDATQDPDAFIFGREQTEEVSEFKATVERKMREARQTTTSTSSKSSVADELRSLAELKKQGMLTDQEFEAAKKKLLS